MANALSRTTSAHVAAVTNSSISCSGVSVPVTVPPRRVSSAAPRRTAIARARACGVMFSHAMRATSRCPKSSHAYAGRTASTSAASAARRVNQRFMVIS